ncbi:MAG: SusD/RagB family nutrient-binding outer membrane lipoprotein, partial [Saprospiraceae bacterium]|nr:SusD/RagB family nutrient-binding outer membrane lipoprotein [Saprospiraceae bacterium]
MKYINKLVMVLMVVAVSSCDITELDLLDNPNAVAPENASVNDLLVSIQGSFDGMLQGMEGFAGGVTRMTALTPFSVYDYTNATQPQNYDGIWNTVYAGLFPDVDALVAIADERNLPIHSGIAKVMKAYAMVSLVDFFGNVPYSQAGQGTDVISPPSDDGASVYAAAEALLDQAISQMSGSTAAKPSTDTYFNGNPDAWVKAANTLKLRMAVTTRLVDGGAAGKINSLIAGGNLIDDASEDWHTNYGQTRTNPNSRHPRYNEHYETTDGGYLGNYFMWLLVGDKRDADDNPVTDPRLRFYFYRQVKDAEVLDKNEYSCHFTDLPDQNLKPAHWSA